MSIAQTFQRLDAPLSNIRTSWGAVRESDGAVFLRVWQHQKRKHDDSWHYLVTLHKAHEANPGKSGYQERLEHVAAIEAGAESYMVMCVAVDPDAWPLKIKSFDERDAFVGGELVELDGESWLQRTDRVKMRSLRL